MRKFFASEVEVPYRIISGAHLDETGKDTEKFDTEIGQLLYATLIQAGAVGFIPHELPIVHELPTMIVGIKLKANVYSFVASLSKEINSYYTECIEIKSRDEFAKAFPVTLIEALKAFKQA